MHVQSKSKKAGGLVVHAAIRMNTRFGPALANPSHFRGPFRGTHESTIISRRSRKLKQAGSVITDEAARTVALAQPVKVAPYFAHAQFSTPDTESGRAGRPACVHGAALLVLPGTAIARRCEGRICYRAVAERSVGGDRGQLSLARL
jgi:hypothetical protein